MRKVLLAAFMILFMSVAANAQTLSVKGLYDQAVLILAKLNDSIDVFVQDQTTEVVDIYMCENQATTTLASPVALEGRTLTLTDDTNFDVGDCIDIAEDGHMMQALIKSTATATNQVTINVPVDRAFTTAAVVKAGSFEQAVDGSVTPRIFEYCAPYGATVDITRVMMGCTGQTVMDDQKWCGLSALTNGWLLRKKNGVYHNIMVSSNNKGLAERAFDLVYSDKAPSGYYGLRWRRTFSGQEKNGVVVRLIGPTTPTGTDGECFQAVVQDNLTGTNRSQASLIQGHLVED